MVGLFLETDRKGVASQHLLYLVLVKPGRSRRLRIGTFWSLVSPPRVTVKESQSHTSDPHVPTRKRGILECLCYGQVICGVSVGGSRSFFYFRFLLGRFFIVKVSDFLIVGCAYCFFVGYLRLLSISVLQRNEGLLS